MSGREKGNVNQPSQKDAVAGSEENLSDGSAASEPERVCREAQSNRPSIGLGGDPGILDMAQTTQATPSQNQTDSVDKSLQGFISNQTPAQDTEPGPSPRLPESLQSAAVHDENALIGEASPVMSQIGVSTGEPAPDRPLRGFLSDQISAQDTEASLSPRQQEPRQSPAVRDENCLIDDAGPEQSAPGDIVREEPNDLSRRTPRPFGPHSWDRQMPWDTPGRRRWGPTSPTVRIDNYSLNVARPEMSDIHFCPEDVPPNPWRVDDCPSEGWYSTAVHRQIFLIMTGGREGREHLQNYDLRLERRSGPVFEAQRSLESFVAHRVVPPAIKVPL